MKILVSGASGLIGSAVVRRLCAAGHQVLPLVRPATRQAQEGVSWEPDAGMVDAAGLEAAGVDGVVHLAGESIAAGRWTERRKARIRDTRVEGTRLLAKTLAALSSRPKVLLSASAVGLYGNRGDKELDETSPPGRGFLHDLCRDWEAATAPAAESGIRVARLRFGLVLDPHGGALARMLLPFRLGLGGPLGNGRQYMSWITRDDATAAIQALLVDLPLEGPVNLVAPQPVTNRQFVKTLGRCLGRPAVLPVPAFLLRLLLGQMADDLLLASARVMPRRLTAAGYVFRHADLESGLDHVLRKD